MKLAHSLLWVIAFTPLLTSAATLPDRPRAVLRQQLVKEDSVTVVVRDVASGESLIELNPLTPRSPASTLKLLPTWAALEMLGPAHSWKTRVYADGPVRGGVLKGNLYLQGGGDPMMTLERWWRLVTDLRQTGLR
ncbi:MAG: D-alanyl-D-alanine carboxypeptidase, partial [Steroidobacteraceae bacterium]